MLQINHIFDFETLGQNTQTCPVVNVAYYTFDAKKFASDDPYTFTDLVKEIKQIKFDLKDQISPFYGYKTEPKTLEWWKSQGEAINALKPSSEDMLLNAAMDKYVNYLENGPKIQTWWSRSNTFDPIILWRLAKDTNHEEKLNNLLKFWLVRDTRTYIDAKFNFTEENGFIPFTDVEKWNKLFIKHNSIHDVAADILRLQAIIRAECGLEHVNE